MNYNDRVYGNTKIVEPIVLELIDLPIMQRLKEVDQGGYHALLAKEFIDFTGHDHSRFDHSVGVYLLLRNYNAPLAEQIAGLLHDVSHTAFSHCIDAVFKKGAEATQVYQDSIHSEYVRNSEIPNVLKKYNLDLDYILNDNHFPLKERNLPALCADRIDYGLREAVIFEEINTEGIKNILDNLLAKNREWVFKNIETAEKFAKLFSVMSDVYFAGPATAIMFKTVSDYLRHAWKCGYIKEKDFFLTDRELLNKIAFFHAGDAQLLVFWDRMNKKYPAIFDSDNYESKIYCKSRVVDPLFIIGDEIKPLSSAKPEWKEIVKNGLKPKEYFLRFGAYLK